MINTASLRLLSLSSFALRLFSHRPISLELMGLARRVYQR